VCHPGGPGFSSLYLQTLGGLDKHFTLILIDPRGTGGSDRPADASAYRIEDYVADLEAVRVGLGIERIDLLGHSHGGVVAMAYASSCPERVGRLVLASTLARFSAEHASAMEAAMASRADEPWYGDARAALEAEQSGELRDDEALSALVMRELPFYFARYGATEEGYVRVLAQEPVNGDALGLFNSDIMATFDLRSELARITADTLVITGSADFITGPMCSREIAAEIAHAQTVMMEDAGHFTFVEAPEVFRREVVGFLGGE
jgi:pimeloyl-ACP methyl ester carboxylesterase